MLELVDYDAAAHGGVKSTGQIYTQTTGIVRVLKEGAPWLELTVDDEEGVLRVRAIEDPLSVIHVIPECSNVIRVIAAQLCAPA